jgi:hypothetical protein
MIGEIPQESPGISTKKHQKKQVHCSRSQRDREDLGEAPPKNGVFSWLEMVEICI